MFRHPNVADDDVWSEAWKLDERFIHRPDRTDVRAPTRQDALDDRERISFIINNEHFHFAQIRFRRSLVDGSVALRVGDGPSVMPDRLERQIDNEGRPLSDSFAFDMNTSAVQFG